MRCRKPSERCASATRPSGALSFRQEIMAAPTLRKLPLDFNHLCSSGSEEGASGGTLVDTQLLFVLQVLQLTRQTTLSDFLGRSHRPYLLLATVSELALVFSDLTSRHATSASYDLNEYNKFIKMISIQLKWKHHKMIGKSD